MQFRPRRDTVDFREEAIAPCLLLFGGVFEVGKTLLHDQLDSGRDGIIVAGNDSHRNGFRKNKSVLP